MSIERVLKQIKNLESCNVELEKDIVAVLKSNKEDLYIKKITHQPNGKQRYPDIHIKFYNGNELELEVKSRQLDKIHFNEGYGNENTLFIFKNTKNKKLTCFHRSRIIDDKDYVFLKKWKDTCKLLKELYNVDGTNNCRLGHLRPKWEFEKNSKLTQDTNQQEEIFIKKWKEKADVKLI